MRKDYSPGGTACEYFDHDQARSRAYRWNEDGLGGICDERQRLSLALALWNGKDQILKERAFGLTGNQGNHGEDVKEYYFYLDATPSGRCAHMERVGIMTRMIFSFLVVICMPAAPLCLAEELAVSRFATEGLAGWEPKIFKGITDYRLVQDNGRTVVRATSKASASGLVKKLRFDPAKYRFLRWSWKIEHPIAAGDEKSKAGDDYAARVYVVFSGHFFWQTKAINYIWANKLRKGESIPSAFTANSMMMAVESGPPLAGRWVTEERDLLADYRRLFGGEPREVSAIAIMTDTDNTGSSATAWYGEIILSTER